MTNLSVAAILAESARRRPEHPAVRLGEAAIGYSRLWDQARGYAAALRSLGVVRHDRVALLAGSCLEYPAAYFGILAAGAVVVPLNAMLKSAEIAYALRDSGARLLIASAALLADAGPAAAATGVRLVTVGGVGAVGEAAPAASAAPAGDRVERLDELAAQCPAIEEYEPCDADDLALVLYTSGTTGRPKGAMLTHANVVMNVTASMLSPFDMQPQDVLLCPLPLFHTFGQICGMLVCFRAGASMVITERFAADQALALMSEHGCTLFMGVPTMFVSLLEQQRAAGPDDRPFRSRLNRAYSGGAALPVAVLEEFERRFSCPIYEGYGLTETSPVVAYNQKAWPRRPGTVGRPIWGVEVAVAAAEIEGRIELRKPGEIGEVVVRGHNVMAGYLGDPAASAAVLVDGWFRTGDLGLLEEDGFLRLVDRKKDMVVRGGYNVYPREVEEVLAAHPSVAAVCVVGVPDQKYGEEVCAVVVPRAAAAAGAHGPVGAALTESLAASLAASLTVWAKERMAAYKYPRRFEFVDALPVGATGKVLKRVLSERYAAPAMPAMPTASATSAAPAASAVPPSDAPA